MTSAYPKKRGGGWVFVPFIVAILLAGVYTAYWFIARGVLERGIDDWVQAERERGMVVEHGEKAISGFPFRFELTVDAPVYGDPNAQVWRGQQLQLVMQPWNFNHVIARSPGRNSVGTATFGDAAQILLGGKSVASLSWTEVGIRRVSVALDEADVAVSGEPAFLLSDFEFHLRPAPDAPTMLQLETHWQEVALARALPGELAALGERIGPSILRLELDEGVPALARTGDPGAAIGEALFAGGELRIPQVMLQWGPAELGARAQVRAPGGEVSGTLGLRIDNAEALRAALAAEGALTDELRQSIDALEVASADGGFFTLSIRNDGLYFLGNRLVELPFTSAL